MEKIFLEVSDGKGLSRDELISTLDQSVSGDIGNIKKVLLIVPDHTRYHSNAGFIANRYYHIFENTTEVDLLVALGTHAFMTEEECQMMFGDIPFDRIHMHEWRTATKEIGTIPADYVSDVSEGLYVDEITVEVNRILWEGYDLILSIGQVVPHEVVGMANHSKNILVGCGGAEMINASHMTGAFYGLERLMGKDHSPVRKLFDYAVEHFLKEMPIWYVLTVTTAEINEINTYGLYIDKGREGFEAAVHMAQQKNMVFVDKAPKKVIVRLDEMEFKSTWLGNKSVYRTRMAIADGGELIILAPGVQSFGEDPAIDSLIRKYGYTGRENIIRLSEENSDLRGNLSAAAHMIHGSSDGRFSITYCTRHLSKEEVEGVGFNWMAYDTAARIYNPTNLREGFNTLENGEEIFYISNPALGLWTSKDKFY